VTEPAEAAWGAWMQAAQAGDGEAYERLLRALLPPLRGFVARRLPDPHAAEDVVQTVLLSIHRARHTYRPERPFGPWWRAVARHAVIDAARARGRRAGREVAFDEELHTGADPPPAAGADQLSPGLQRALDALPPTQREAVSLLHVEGLGVAEAARRAGTSPGALKVRAHRGYQRLRRLLGGSS